MTAAKITSAPIFRPLNRYGTVGKKALSGLAVPRIVKEALTQAGIGAKNYSGHSVRAGLGDDHRDVAQLRTQQVAV